MITMSSSAVVIPFTPQPKPVADKKLSKTQRADMAFRYLDWLLTKRLPNGGFQLLYAVTQRFTDDDPFECWPAIEWLAEKIG